MLQRYQDVHYKRAARVLETKTIYEDDPVQEYEFLFDKLDWLLEKTAFLLKKSTP
jgi:hypothetical protein